MRRLPLLLLLVLIGCTQNVPLAPEAKPRPDQPGEANAFYEMKRGGTADVHGAYAAARTAMRKMPIAASAQADVATNAGNISSWEPLGPGNIGGRTRVLAIDPDKPEIMYTGGVSGGLWKTADGGAFWKPVGDELANLAINSLAMHPADSRILYAGTGEGYFREVVRGTALPLRGNGMFVTRDAGETWTQLASTRNNEDFHWVNDLAISRHDPNRVYAATRTGVWRSNDAGETWTRTLDGTNVQAGCLDLAWRPGTDGDYFFVSCGTFDQATVYRHKNAESDTAWESVLSEPNMSRTTLAVAPSDPNVVYALAASNEPGILNQGLLAVFRSNASGDPGSWTAQVTNKVADRAAAMMLTNPYAATRQECATDGQAPANQYVTMGWYCNTIAVDPTNPDRLFTGGVDIFRSDDGGKTWGVASYWWANETASAFAHADQHAIAFHPRFNGTTNQIVYFMNDGGVYRTENALAEVARGPRATCDVFRSKVAFTPLNHNFGITQFYHGAVFPDGTRYLGGAQDNGTLLGNDLEGHDKWQRVFGGDGAYVAVDPVDPKIVYTSFQVANIVKSTNGGETFVFANLGLNDNFLFITPFILDPNNHLRLWTGGRRVWRSDNATASWFPVSELLPGQLSAVAVAHGNSDLVLVGTNNGFIARTEKARTITRFETWPTVKPRDGFVSSLQFEPNSGSVVYATYAGFGGQHVWKSIDAGLTWTSIDSDLPDIPVHSIAIDPTQTDRLFLGTDLGVFVSTNGGASWQVENTGFAAVVTEWITIGQGTRGPAVYAFTHGRGAWRAELVPAGPRRRGVRR